MQHGDGGGGEIYVGTITNVFDPSKSLLFLFIIFSASSVLLFCLNCVIFQSEPSEAPESSI